MSRCILEDCKECGDPQISLWPCDFCREECACDECFREVWKTCPECGQTGGLKHFDGMYCYDCVNEWELYHGDKDD